MLIYRSCIKALVVYITYMFFYYKEPFLQIFQLFLVLLLDGGIALFLVTMHEKTAISAIQNNLHQGSPTGSLKSYQNSPPA